MNLFQIRQLKVKPPTNPKLREFEATGMLNVRTTLERVVLAGGATRSFITNENPTDYDIFIISDPLLGESLLKPVLVDFCEKQGWKNKFTCPEGLLYSYKAPFGKVSIVAPSMYRQIPQLIRTFDLSPCRAAWDGTYLYCSYQFVRDVKKRIAHLQHLDYPLATMGRLYKYQRKGFDTRPAQEEFLSMFADGIINGRIPDAHIYRRYID